MLMDFKHLRQLKERYSERDFRTILLIVEEDLKFNNVRFNKPVREADFLRVLNITENMYRRDLNG